MKARITSASPVRIDTPYHPEPSTYYLCPYCNRPARLRDAEVVVDSYKNICHYQCLMRIVTAKEK